MNRFNEFPAEDMPLRDELPRMREATQELLIEAALHWPGAMSWLLQRQALYLEAGHAMSHLVDATCALDLLKWRLRSKSDKAAVEMAAAFSEAGTHQWKE